MANELLINPVFPLSSFTSNHVFCSDNIGSVSPGFTRPISSELSVASALTLRNPVGVVKMVTVCSAVCVGVGVGVVCVPGIVSFSDA